MVWNQLSINKPHLVYIILGGFTSIFMLVSLFIKEKLYIGEATVATICGLIFGPHAANLIDPGSWGNTDQITLEFSRIVLVVQCFAVGVELPKSYMERHWTSVTLLLVPVMTFGWLITSLFVWWMITPLSWLESLCVAACVTATDPVLASSVVGKGKFAKRVPKHIRDLLSAESGCNDGMAFPFIYLSLNLIRFHLNAREVTFHWICYTILYECIFGAVYGVLVGYLARHAIRLAERKGVIDRESFLVFYFVLALFCAGSGSMLGMDDLLIGFAAGVGFSNDGWFTSKTEESHVSNVIDLLLNLSYFVYFGTIIPWDQFNSHVNGLDAWRLVVIALFVVFFRRIPIMLMLKPIIPDIKTWREALFCGHFGPIGVGAIFVAILARAELETETTTPLANPPGPEHAEYALIYTIWPITTFLVLTSIVVHGSSIAVFTLGKRINTLTLTLSYTQGNDQSSSWMNRLPRIASQSKSMSRMDSSDLEDEKLDFPPGQLPPVGIPKLQLRRQKEDEYAKPQGVANGSRVRSRSHRRKKNKYEGGPISQSAIAPARRSDPALSTQESSNSDTLREKSEEPSPEVLSPDQVERLTSGGSESDPERQQRASEKEEGRKQRREEPRADSPAHVEAYEEGHHLIVEDAEGNVLENVETRGRTDEEKATLVETVRKKLKEDTSGKYAKNRHESHDEGTGLEQIQSKAEESTEQRDKKFTSAFKGWKGFSKKDGQAEGGEGSAFKGWKGFGKKDGQAEGGEGSAKTPERKRGPAHAYQFGNTIIVEDEDGEVIKTYTLPRGEGEADYNKRMREGMHRMSTFIGLGRKASQAPAVPNEVLEEAEDDALNQTQGEKPAEASAPKKDTKPKKRDDEDAIFGDDDGLRMVISRQDEYGLMGLRKPKGGDRPDLITTGGGRRMSTRDFLMQMNKMDKDRKMSAIDASDAPEDVKNAARRGEKPIARPTAAKRVETGAMPAHQEQQEEEAKEAEDYFSEQPASPAGKESRTPGTPGAVVTPGARPYATRADTGDTLSTIGEDVPTHNVRGTVARHVQGQGLTAAEQRRQRFSSAKSEEGTDAGDDDDERETAAERRRRLGALGIKTGHESSSESEDEDAPRMPKPRAVQEPEREGGPTGVPSKPQVPAPVAAPTEPAPRMRIQWGGETRGHVRGDEDDATGNAADGASSGPNVGKRFKGLFKK